MKKFILLISFSNIMLVTQSEEILNMHDKSFPAIAIKPFEQKYNEQVINLISSIQQQEFNVQVTPQEQPDLRDIAGFFKKGQFLVALENENVIGTIGFLDIGNGNGVLRKMFVHADYRGKGVANQLLNQILAWSKQHAYTKIYLGTVPILYAAHKFYEKNGFIEITEDQLPSGFPLMAVDKKFYKYDL